MKLAGLTWKPYRIPFCGPFVTAHGPLNNRSGALVTAHTDEGYTGTGEIAPLPEQSGASLGAALSALPGLIHTLRGRELGDILHFLAAQNEEGQLPSSLICGLEIALLDALGKARGQSIATLLASGYPYEEKHASASPRVCVSVNAVIGGAAIEKIVESARTAIKAGFTCLKLKLTDASQAAIDRVATLRAAIGPEVSLRLDANAGWNFEQALFLLTQCAPFDIQYVEQPMPALNLADMARLRISSPIPIAADEAVSDLNSARRILEAEAADVLILKPQLAGGLQSCRQIIQEASSRHVSCVLTSALEAGIGVAATLHLAAASPEVTLPCGLATLALLEDDLLQEDLAIEQGNMIVPAGSGLGVTLDTSSLHI